MNGNTGHRGHLFIVQADMTRLAADAYVIPCDGTPELTNHWRKLVEASEMKASHRNWFRPKGVTLKDGIAVVEPAQGDSSARQDEIGGVRVLVDTVSAGDRLDAIVDCALRGVRAAAARAAAHAGRVRPLIAIPLLGVGAGLFAGQRAQVVSKLVSGLHAWVNEKPAASERGCDVAFVLYETADYAAAQWQRSLLCQKDEYSFWPELNDEHRHHADRLGNLAATGNLSVFAGAGVSVPLGFPKWDELLKELADEGKVEIDLEPKDGYLRAADKLQASFSDLNERVADKFKTERHALGHGLIACLRTRTMVTTNYDPCLENAAERVHKPAPRVLARELPDGDNPWVLKLHGDVAAPESIVLSSNQYETLTKDRRALRGVVQTLMLTSHLLFVGFGFAESDFADMYEAVRQARAMANPKATAKFGTTISLKPSHKSGYEEIVSLSTGSNDKDPEASRRLEILLDRLAFTAQIQGPLRAAYVLDPAYAASASKHDRAVRDVVERLTQLAAQKPGSPVSGVVSQFRRQLGMN